MQTFDAPYLTYFLQTYWNQASDLLYDNIGQAVQDFQRESAEYRNGLAADLDRAMNVGLTASDFSDKIYDGPFWAKFDRVINSQEALLALSKLRGAGGPAPASP